MLYLIPDQLMSFYSKRFLFPYVPSIHLIWDMKINLWPFVVMIHYLEVKQNFYLQSLDISVDDTQVRVELTSLAHGYIGHSASRKKR